jgi:hypothetical protein
VITQKAILNTTLVLSQTVLDVSGTGTGAEILNTGTLVEANHFGGGSVAEVKLANGLILGTSTTSMTGWDDGAWGGQNTDDDSQGWVNDAVGTESPFAKLMISYRWNSVQTASAAIPGLIVGHTYRLQWITISPRGGNVSVEGSASVPLTGSSDAPMVLTFIWQATDTSANILVTRQNNPHYGGNYDSEMCFNGYALHDMGGGSGGGYAAWALLHADGGPANGDANNDGVQNGIAYFMGVTGPATNPVLDEGNTVTWPMSATFSGTYEVQTSPDLGTWTDVTPKPTRNGNGNLVYTLLPGQGKQFVRLVATPN